LDLDGVTLAHRAMLPFLKAITKIDEDNYPETLGLTVVLNAPWVFHSVLWKIIKPWLDPVVAAKVQVYGSDFKEQLLKDIDADSLPEEYGGTCQCQGGCIPMFSIEESKQAIERMENTKGIKIATVQAGSKLDIVHKSVGQGNEAWWYFRTHDYDITFSIQFTPKGSQQSSYLFEVAKVDSHQTVAKGSTPCEEGEIKFTFDNTSAWRTEKVVHYAVGVQRQEEKTPIQREEQKQEQLEQKQESKEHISSSPSSSSSSSSSSSPSPPENL